MKNWCRINIPGWQDHQTQLKKCVLSKVGNSSQVYNYISIEDFRSECAALAHLLETQLGKLERLAIFKMDHESMKRLKDNAIHIDSGLQTARLNWPILNPNSVVTKYFKITDPDYQPTRYFFNPPYKDYIDIYDSAHCKEVDSVCIDQPTVFNVFKPHSMFVNGDVWPRVMASFNFLDPAVLAKYLEDSAENL
jgi:hypothetical protein